MDDQAYLEPGFDPSTLTVPRLRSILVAHNIDYPSSSKKSQLIEIFNESVLPQARKIRQANSRVKRTSRGIEDIGTGRKGTGAGDPDDEDIPPTPATGRSTRRTTRARTEEAVEVEPTPRGVRHSTAPPEGVTPRTVSGKHARTVETVREEEQEPEPERKRISRTPRVSAVTPSVKREDEDSPFSNQNVFQSGGSSEVRSRDPDRRRTTLGNNAARDLERRHQQLRRRTDGVSPVKRQLDGAVVPTRKTFDVPVSAFKQEEIEPSEEFTPEEEMEMVQAQQAGELVPATRRTKRPGSNAKLGVGATLTVVLATLASFWGQEKFKVGYCGVGEPSSELAGVEIPPWADQLRPQCEPCPPHAYCQKDLKTECENGFVLTHHPLSVNGFLPIPPTCEPDSARARKVESVKSRAIETLRQQNADYECGSATKPEIRETDLKQAIATKRRKGMTNEEFEDLWASAIGEVAQMDEVHSGADGAGHAVLRSSNESAIPFACAIRRSLRQTLREYVWWIVAVLMVLSSGSYGRYRITSGNETEIQAKRLASLALEKLSVQASLNAADPSVYPENYISVAHLRDDVLRDEFRQDRRNKLWEKVQKKVEGNANVRPMVREGKSGDVGRVWEWVGAVSMLENSPGEGGGPRRRKSGRVSFADEGDLSSSRMLEGSSMSGDRSEGQVQRWQENRSYY